MTVALLLVLFSPPSGVPGAGGGSLDPLLVPPPPADTDTDADADADPTEGCLILRLNTFSFFVGESSIALRLGKGDAFTRETADAGNEVIGVSVPCPSESSSCSLFGPSSWLALTATADGDVWIADGIVADGDGDVMSVWDWEWGRLAVGGLLDSVVGAGTAIGTIGVTGAGGFHPSGIIDFKRSSEE